MIGGQGTIDIVQLSSNFEERIRKLEKREQSFATLEAVSKTCGNLEIKLCLLEKKINQMNNSIGVLNLINGAFSAEAFNSALSSSKAANGRKKKIPNNSNNVDVNGFDITLVLLELASLKREVRAQLSHIRVESKNIAEETVIKAMKEYMHNTISLPEDSPTNGERNNGMNTSPNHGEPHENLYRFHDYDTHNQNNENPNLETIEIDPLQDATPKYLLSYDNGDRFIDIERIISQYTTELNEIPPPTTTSDLHKDLLENPATYRPATAFSDISVGEELGRVDTSALLLQSREIIENNTRQFYNQQQQQQHSYDIQQQQQHSNKERNKPMATTGSFRVEGTNSSSYSLSPRYKKTTSTTTSSGILNKNNSYNISSPFLDRQQPPPLRENNPTVGAAEHNEISYDEYNGRPPWMRPPPPTHNEYFISYDTGVTIEKMKISVPPAVISGQPDGGPTVVHNKIAGLKARPFTARTPSNKYTADSARSARALAAANRTLSSKGSFNSNRRRLSVHPPNTNVTPPTSESAQYEKTPRGSLSHDIKQSLAAASAAAEAARAFTPRAPTLSSPSKKSYKFYFIIFEIILTIIYILYIYTYISS